MAGGPSPSAAAGVDSGGPGADAGGDGTGAIASGPAGGSSNGGRAPAPGAAAQAQVSAVQIAAGPEPVADETEVAVAQAVAGGDKAVRPGPAAGEPPQRLPVNPGRTPRTPEKVQEALPAPDAEPDPQSAQANGAPEHERPKPGADPKSGPPPKAAPHVATVVAPADDGHPGEAGSSGSSRAHHQAADTPAPASVALAPVRPTATPKAKARPGEAPIDDAEISREARPSPSAAIPGPGLVRIGRMRASRWTAQVFQDVILPTRPVPISDAEAVDGMRESLKRERLSGMPPSLMHPREQRGFSFEFTADPTGAPEWRELSGSAATAIVQGNRAELTLSPVGSEARTFVLGFRDGRMVARVDIGPEGTPALSIAAGTRSWYWIGVEHPKAEGSFSWRLASGGSAPGSWARNDRWLGDRGQRIDIPLEPSGQGANRYAVALVDPSTGCGIASSLTRD